MPQDNKTVPIDDLLEGVPAQEPSPDTPQQGEIPIDDLLEGVPAQTATDTPPKPDEAMNKEMDFMAKRLRDINAKIEDLGEPADSTRSFGAYGVGVGTTQATQLSKLKAERDKLQKAMEAGSMKKYTQQEEARIAEKMAMYPEGDWENIKTRLQNTWQQIKAAPFDVATAFKMPSYQLEKIVDKGTSSLEDRGTITKETSDIIKQVIGTIASQTPAGFGMMGKASAQEDLAYTIGKSSEFKGKVKPTMPLIDAIQHGSGSDIAIATFGGALNYLPSILVGAATKGLGFIPLFAGGGFADVVHQQAAEREDIPEGDVPVMADIDLVEDNPLLDNEIRQVLNEFEVDATLPAVTGIAAGLMEWYGLKKVQNFFMGLKLSKPALNAGKEVLTVSGRQGFINWGEGVLQHYNLEYARTGSLGEAAKESGKFMYSRDGLNQGLEAFAGTLATAGLSRAGRLSFDAHRRYAQKPKEINLKGKEGTDYGFIGKKGEYFLRTDNLTAEDAQLIKQDLEKKYPNMGFEIQDNTDRTDPQAESNYTVRAEEYKNARKAEEPAPPPELSITKEGETTTYKTEEQFLEALRTVEDPSNVEFTINRKDAQEEQPIFNKAKEILEERVSNITDTTVEQMRKRKKVEVEKETDPKKYVENNQEKLIGEGEWDGGHTTRHVLEGGEQVFKEALKSQPKKGNIREALDRIRDYIAESKTEQHEDDTYQSAQQRNKNNFKQLSEQWENQPANTDMQQAAKDLNLALTRGEFDKASVLAEEIARQIAPAERKGETIPVPDDISSNVADTFFNAVEGKQKSRVDAAVEARQVMMDSQWYKDLSEADQQAASRKADEIIGEVSKETKEAVPALATRKPEARRTLDIEASIRKASRKANLSTREEIKAFAKDMSGQISKALKAKTISENDAKSIRNNIINASTAKMGGKTQKRHLENALQQISRVNDPVVKADMADIAHRLDAMMEYDKITKIGEGRRVFRGTKTPEYANIIKSLVSFFNKRQDPNKEMDIEGERNEMMTKAIEAENAEQQQKQLDEMADFDMSFGELAYNIANLRNLQNEFLATKTTEYGKRQRLLNRAVEMMGKISQLEEASIKARKQMREAAEQELRDRKKLREDHIEGTKMPERQRKEVLVEQFRVNLGVEGRGGAFNELRASVEHDTSIPAKRRDQIIAELDKIEAKENPKLTDLTKVEELMGAVAKEAYQSKIPAKSFGPLQAVASFFKGAYYDNLRGLLRWLVVDRGYTDTIMELDRMADRAAERYAELSEHSHLQMDKLLSVLQLPPDFRNKGMLKKGMKRFIGTETGNQFYIKKEEYGLSKNAEQEDVDGAPIKDFMEFSHNDLVYIDLILRDSDNIRVLEKSYSEGTIAALKEHAANHVKNNSYLAEFSERLKNDIVPDIYNITNETYKQRFGTDMPRLENYMRRVAEQPRVTIGKSPRKSLIPTHILERRDPAKLVLKDVDVIKTVSDMYESANKWNAFYETQKRWGNIYTDKKVISNIENNIPNGKRVIKHLQDLYEAYPDGPEQAHFGIRAIRNVVMSNIMGSVGMTIKQASSIPNALTDFNSQLSRRGMLASTAFSEAVYLRYLVDPKHMGSFWEQYWDSPTIKDRLRRGPDPHVRVFLDEAPMLDLFKWTNEQKAKVSTAAQKIRFINEMWKKLDALPVKAGDIVPFMAIKPNYHLRLEKYLSEGMEMQAASKKAFERSVSEAFRTQQPAGRTHLLSAFQVGRIGRNIPYITAPIQMGQQLRLGVRDFVNPESTPAERVAGAKNMFYYGYVQPAIWVWASRLANNFVSKGFQTMTELFMTGHADPEELEKATAKDIDDATEYYEFLNTLAAGLTQGAPYFAIAKDYIQFQLEGKPYEPALLPGISMLEEIGRDGAKVVDTAAKKPYKEWTDYEKFINSRFWGNFLGAIGGHGFPSYSRYIRMIKNHIQKLKDETPEERSRRNIQVPDAFLDIE